MDWEECIKNNIVKQVSTDKQIIYSIMETARLRIESANILPDKYIIIKISLMYDALREYLEVKALDHGFKIYNHACYGAFLKEYMRLPEESYMFDSLRKVRNGINYYGLKLEMSEAYAILNDINLLLSRFDNS